ncbi:TOPRIM nucleotidyl transferase/hydrolase domain-containing protein [Leifsonia sp. NPDC058292]|uniref:TOPRIM nucleotidyl transferase/hydrolase domain-containing protein n=1 Tax=Leifsonia sp. NPDC058292 TaxID=3346428 RepID=UPI0036DD921A
MTEQSGSRSVAGDARVEGMRVFERAAEGWASGRVDPAESVAAAEAAASDGVVRAAILVEGASDRAALHAIASAGARDLRREGVAVLAMGGAMSIRRYVEVLGIDGIGLELHGLCDVGEIRFFERAGMTADTFEICDPDLEGELIRSLGVAAVEDVLATQNDLRLFRTFQRQPAQRERSPEQQLHRFLGTTSGRKEQYARELSLAAAASHAVPDPLRRLLEQV